MKHKVTRRLVGYFLAVLLLFSVIVSFFFFSISIHHTAALHEQELKERAVTIAETLSSFPQTGRRGHGMGNGYGAYLRFIDEIAMSEVWLVDEKAQTIHMGHMRSALSYEELPPGAEALVKQVFRGNVEGSGAFSSLLGTPSITVGAPIRGPNGAVQAALLLHSPISGLDRAQTDSIIIFLLCAAAAFLLAGILSMLLARRFIDPLQKMEAATNQLIRGNYSIQTQVRQNDEFGLLARNIDELSARLSQTEQEREKLERMRRDFVSNVSHELRTPVTVLKGSLEVLAEGLVTDPQEMQGYFHQMLADTAHLQRLVNDLLELSRLQNMDFQIDKEPCSLGDVLSEAVRSMRRVAVQKQVEIVLTNSAGAFSFWGDYGRLRQMITIILDNAVKFSPMKETVEVKLHLEQNGCVLTIRDHGPGIPPEDVPHIFDRFYREASEQNKTGTGLGLSIAKQIAERHGIKISCKSQFGDGSAFSFVFPQDLSEQ